jgi:hypothetical protein
LESVPTKEIAEAVLSASGSLASLLLVFIAFVFTKADSLPSGIGDAKAKRYKRYARLGLVLVIAYALEMLTAYVWLFWPTCTLVFHVWAIGFLAVTLLLVAYAAIAISQG